MINKYYQTFHILVFLLSVFFSNMQDTGTFHINRSSTVLINIIKIVQRTTKFLHFRQSHITKINSRDSLTSAF